MTRLADGIKPPGPHDIEQMFSTRRVRAARPMLRGGIELIKKVRKLEWRAEGLENAQSPTGPVIYAANHVSHIDTAAILDCLPHRIRSRTAVAAALDVFSPDKRSGLNALPRLCLQWTVASAFHAFAFDRQGSPMRSIRTAVHLIRHDWNLLLYPEGTRSRTGEIGPFKPGVGVIARFSGRPVVPVHVSGGIYMLPCGAFLPRPGELLIRFGKQLEIRRGESPEAFTQRLRLKIAELAPADYLASLPPAEELLAAQQPQHLLY